MRGPYRWRWYFARLAALASPLAAHSDNRFAPDFTFCEHRLTLNPEDFGGRLGGPLRRAGWCLNRTSRQQTLTTITRARRRGAQR
jgi:hypothetical protein